MINRYVINDVQSFLLLWLEEQDGRWRLLLHVLGDVTINKEVTADEAMETLSRYLWKNDSGEWLHSIKISDAVTEYHWDDILPRSRRGTGGI